MTNYFVKFRTFVSIYLFLRVIRISIMSIIAFRTNVIGSFDQMLVVILKNGCHAHLGAIL